MAKELASIATRLFEPDPNVRLHAIEQASQEPDPWALRLLLCCAAFSDRKIAQRAEEAVQRRKDSVSKVLLRELDSPVAKVRVVAMRQLRDKANLAHIPRILTCLFDPNVDARQETRRTLIELADKFVRAHHAGAQAREAYTAALRALSRAGRTSDNSARKTAVLVLIKLSRVNPEEFWMIFRTMDERARRNVQLEFISSGNEEALPVLYLGLLTGDTNTENNIAHLIQRNFNNLDQSRHLERIGSLTLEEQGKLAIVMEDLGLLNLFTENISRLRSRARQIVLDLVEFLDLERYTRFLQRCADIEDVQLRTRALRLLDRLQPGSTENRAADLLQSSDVREVVAGLELLRAHPTRQTIEKVRPLLAHPSELIRRAASRTTFQITKQLLLNNFDSYNPASRLRILNQLDRLNPDLATDLIQEWSESTEEKQRVHLALLLPQLADRPEIENALDMLEIGATTRVRATLTRVFGALRTDVLRLQRLVPLLHDSDARVRANAIEELPAQLPDTVRERLHELARSETPRERANAIHKLITIGESEYEISLVRMLEDVSPQMRASGLWVAGKLGFDHLADHMREALDEDDPHLRRQAILALGAIAPDNVIQSFDRFLKDPAPEVRTAARDVLRNRLKLSYEIEEG